MNLKSRQFDLTVVIPARNEAENLAELLPRIKETLSCLQIDVEIIVVDELPDDQTREIVEKNHAVLLSPNTRGYGSAIISGIKQSHGNYVTTMDADLSHLPTFLLDLWQERESAEVLIASRYIHGGKACMPFGRLFLSKTLNLVFSRGLDLGIRDMSSGFRLYKRSAILNLGLSSKNFDIQQEILVKAFADGYRVREIPFSYQPRRFGFSHARVFRFSLDYVKAFSRLWRLRNSIHSADYDARAYNSWVVIQRYWQRQRFKHIIELSKGHSKIIDVGCGSSRILGAIPPSSIGLDILDRKLRFARRFNKNLVQGSALALPVKTHSFNCVICSQVIEHIAGRDVLGELDRILIPGGKLILGTPDYDNWQWRMIEWFYDKLLPQGYADEHITKYTYDQLIQYFVIDREYKLKETRYILQGELIMALEKPGIV